jgi:hypothetical protein
MGKRILFVLAAFTCAVALTAGTAGADAGKRSLIVFTVQNIGDASAACPGSLFGLSFEMVLGRAKLGTGLSCVRSVEGCATAGCRQTINTTFTLTFARGTLTAPMVLEELFLTDTLVLTRDRGSISSGTGAFASATGSINCVGTIRFTATAPIPKVACLVRIH